MAIAFAMAAFDPGMVVAPQRAAKREHPLLRKSYVIPVIPKGCKEYFIDGVRVVALNEKNAIKKAQKLKAL